MYQYKKSFSYALVAILFGTIGFMSGGNYPSNNAALEERHQALKELNGLCGDLNDVLLKSYWDDSYEPIPDFDIDTLIDDYLSVPEEYRAQYNELILDLAKAIHGLSDNYTIPENTGEVKE